MFKWEKIEQVIGLSLILSLFLAHFMRNKQISMKSHSNFFYFSRRLASTKRFSPLQNMCRFKWAQFHFRLASSSNNTISITLSLSLHLYLYIIIHFSFLLNVFYFHFPKLVLFFYVFGFNNNFNSPFSQDNRSENMSRFCLW